ncbi:MAG: hypothetical protein UV80_C0006G0084 [Candidatus Peregrinibacteria bacterium GW2011_GWF2_43_17]|nr:MAG: hypothetical protein UV80_C0006G0084 [Candidatus Peregrinibacteria bacterium GW2011_GWF2_43_17]KKT19441.1 MAG: hypothetical protein UW03_C0018G0020 [Candidatus Peregrinibacteria bacterium GW2011_GWA2_43_8]HAU40104.1 hypothetical protein [Candidatus Peregrinibacteria bacterium]
MFLSSLFRPGSEPPPYRVVRMICIPEYLEVGKIYLLESLLSRKALIVIFDGKTSRDEYHFRAYETNGGYRGTLADSNVEACDIFEIEVDDGFLQDDASVPISPSMCEGPVGLAERVKWIMDGCPSQNEPWRPRS